MAPALQNNRAYLEGATMITKRFLYTAFLVAVLAQAGFAATFTVEIWGDYPDSNPGDGVCDISSGLCSLRAAVMESIANPATFDVIIIPPGEYNLTIAGTDENLGATGDLDVRNVNIYGSSA